MASRWRALALVSLCLPIPASQQGVPGDFWLLLDAESADSPTQHVNVRIDARGHGRFDRYDSKSAITYDTAGMVTYEADQVLQRGTFDVPPEALERLWAAIQEHGFFDLTGDYRMEIGFSWAFIVVRADHLRHRVDNIGMEVPEIRAIVEAIQTVLPEGLRVRYRRGHVPGRR